MVRQFQLVVLLGSLALLAGCSGETGSLQAQTVESCMLCHNGSLDNNYSGPGIENPHPFTAASQILCTTCHGGNPDGEDMLTSHVPPPPEIGDRNFQDNNARAYFNRLTLAGMDKFPNYTVDGVTYTALDYLQFVNPGDLRITSVARGCGQCHVDHSSAVAKSPLATGMGVMAGAWYAAGMDQQLPASAGLHNDTASEFGFRAVTDTNFAANQNIVGAVSQLLEAPVFSQFGQTGADKIFNNPAYDAAELDDDVNADRSVITGSPLAHLFMEQVEFTCGDCHLGSAGANNRAGDFRSSGCSACHMPYSLSGRSGSTDPNINKLEPVDPDDIDDPERAHTRSHQIRSIAKTLPSGVQVQGIDDHTCAGCHQGSNRTVLQFWGIRLDQNADVRNHRQYPANPADSETTHNDQRLYPDDVDNNTFNGRNGNQYLLAEDYDGDGRDDTPADVHYEAGMGCVDCHGSFDLHGDVGGADPLLSRMEQHVAISCESCHGTIDEYAETQLAAGYDGVQAERGLDGAGNTLKHVYKAGDGNYYLKSRLTGNVHYIPQTKDTVSNNGRVNPFSQQAVYTDKASYAMGRIDANAANGTGPKQAGDPHTNFSHTDRMDCVACHGAWTNTCMGCHLSGEYNTGNNFSNITGERIVFKQRTADFTYQSPLFFQLGVNTHGKITQFSSNTKVFFRWEDRFGQLSRVFAFSDRAGAGNNPSSAFPALAHNTIMAHSIRGRVRSTDEGVRYCSACHLTDSSITQYGTQYDAFRTAMQTGNFGTLDFNLLRQHFGQNTGNQLDSPMWAHMAAGLGTGLFLFDVDGKPVNPIDTFAGRIGCDGVAPATVFNNGVNVFYNLDRIVEPSGVSNSSNNHVWLDPAVGPALRDGALDPEFAGPLGASLVQMLADPNQGLVLDAWINADGGLMGNAAIFMGQP